MFEIFDHTPVNFGELLKTVCSSPLEGVLQVQLFQRVVFGGDEGFALGEETVSGARVVSGELDHAARGEVLRCGKQLVHNVGIGAAEILRVTGIGDQVSRFRRVGSLLCNSLLRGLGGGIHRRTHFKQSAVFIR